MKQVPLKDSNLFALVDDADYETVSRYKWGLMVAPNTYYARTWVDGTTVLMHRLLMCAKAGERVDHKDSNGLNNQRSNMRRATSTQNGGNSRKHAVTRSKYKGVTYDKRNKYRKWIAAIKVNYTRYHIGNYITEEEAAAAYDTAARKAFGEFALTNF